MFHPFKQISKKSKFHSGIQAKFACRSLDEPGGRGAVHPDSSDAGIIQENGNDSLMKREMK